MITIHCFLSPIPILYPDAILLLIIIWWLIPGLLVHSLKCQTSPPLKIWIRRLCKLMLYEIILIRLHIMFIVELFAPFFGCWFFASVLLFAITDSHIYKNWYHHCIIIFISYYQTSMARTPTKTTHTPHANDVPNDAPPNGRWRTTQQSTESSQQ